MKYQKRFCELLTAADVFKRVYGHKPSSGTKVGLNKDGDLLWTRGNTGGEVLSAKATAIMDKNDYEVVTIKGKRFSEEYALIVYE